MALKKGFLVLVIAVWVVGSMSATGAARLGVGSGSLMCWDALRDMKSCANEYFMLIIDQMDVSPDCCRVVNLITDPDYCWPDYVMLIAVGFSSEEAKILADHCRVSSTDSAGAPSYTAAAATFI